jgi:phosphate transport system substrate-binding protein
MEKKTKYILKLIISALIGLIATVCYFFLVDDYFLYYKMGMSPIDIALLMILSYLSIIAFLIFWNTKKTKKVYFLLLAPLFFGVAMPVIIHHIRDIRLQKFFEYQESIENIPTVGEYGINLHEYWPFGDDNLLVKLNEESSFKMNDNLPVLDGATAFFPVYASFVETVYPYIFNDTLFCRRTEMAYRNLSEGKVDIIFCLEPSDLQIEQFHDNGVMLKLVPIGREAFVFFVNKENPIDNVTIENIGGIYSGKIKNWQELNGINQGIRAYQREKNSGSQTIFEKVMENIPIQRPLMEDVFYEMGEIIKEVAVYRNFPDAIGYSFLHYSKEMVKNDQIKLLSINGIYPSRETIQNGMYPFSENFYAVYIDNDTKNENIEPFIEWILSRQGQTLISMTGYIPIFMDGIE